MPPRAPVVWTTQPTRTERIRQRLDGRHSDLSRDARSRGARYRDARTGPADPETIRLRVDFLASLGRLAAFESASLSLSCCRFDAQLRAYADDLSRDYFRLWQLVARRGSEQDSLEERSSERLDYFATQLGRLEGLADALTLAGRNVRLFPLPPMPWATVA